MGRDHVLPGSLGRLSRHRSPVVAIGWLAVITLLIGLPLTYVYGGVPTFGYLAGVGSLPVVLIGAGIADLLRAGRPAVFQALGRRAAPDESS